MENGIFQTKEKRNFIKNGKMGSHRYRELTNMEK
jgi:hypothetical protein